MEHENSSTQKETQQKRMSIVYEQPAVIYEGIISTRAGSPLGGTNNNGADGVDPADLFD